MGLEIKKCYFCTDIKDMIMIIRELQKTIEERLFQGKAIIVIGARQVGKSTLFRQITEAREEKVLSLNCDESEVKMLLSNANAAQLEMLIADNKIVVIDEAQRINNIGLVLKRIVDNFPDVQLLVTGSSSFELQNELNEPLTGRKYEYNLFPISTTELLKTNGLISVTQQLEQRLIYGSYPDVINHYSDAKELLMNITGSYLYKDILALDNIRKPQLLDKLLVALSLQIGSEVSYNELAQTVGTDNKTIEKYIDLLEKCFVIFRLSAFSRNLRTELKKSRKIYFYDNGIRNALIRNFSSLELRQDVGALWENFFISERIKYNHYARTFAKSYFWRTTDKKEIDSVEELDGKLSVLEMKCNPKRKNTAIPDIFLQSYDVEKQHTITPDNYIEWV